MKRQDNGYVSTETAPRKRGAPVPAGAFYIDFKTFGQKPHLGTEVSADIYVNHMKTVLVEKDGQLFALTEDDLKAYKKSHDTQN